MHTLYEDIYTSYPELSRGLTNVSNELLRLSLRGACNSLIGRKELSKHIDYNSGNNVSVILISDTIETYGAEIKMIYRHNFLDIMNYVSYTANISAGITEIPVMDIEEFKKSSEQYLPDDIDSEETTSVYVDVKTAYDIFSNRKQCLQYPDYAKESTMNYLNNVVSTLSNHLPTLSFYLVSNLILLDLPIFTTMEELYDAINEESHEDLKNIIKEQLEEINTFINNVLL